ncbi:MAG TPA: DegQ family serine endoprotease [Acidiferrobacteraceae bacterium]|nr:DegQ family serine endoprotease [Acidiferrobacteraceae bacterium]HEX19487.1 DegQ family serine endoprotease [Acidiferrobacteraceae bacterium]
MSLDKKSFKYGLFAGVLLLTGILLGIILTARMQWTSPVQSNPVVLTSDTASSAISVNGLPNFVPVVKATSPAVVNISTTRIIKRGSRRGRSPFNDPFFKEFFGDDFSKRFQMPRKRRQSSLGSGVIVDASGYIVTNNHVIAKADKIKVVLSDKREFSGKVIGTDPKTDIAVIKINAKNLPVIPWGDSSKLDVGEYVLAIGNPYGLKQTVTMGIVSAVGRSNVGIADYEDFIQTDAAINPGNSGGALVNSRGQLIGINTAIFSRSGGNMGIGFAVPANMARHVLKSLLKDGKVVRGWLGVSIQNINGDLATKFGLKKSSGALVSEIIPGSPASKAKLRAGDVIISFDGKAVNSSTTLRNVVAETPVGKKVQVRVIRNKRNIALVVVTGEQPKNISRRGPSVEKSAPNYSVLGGVEVSTLTPDIRNRLGLSQRVFGVVVTRVNPESSAASRLRSGDVITSINNQRVRSLSDYNKITRTLKRNSSVLLYLNRRGRMIYLVIKP